MTDQKPEQTRRSLDFEIPKLEDRYLLATVNFRRFNNTKIDRSANQMVKAAAKGGDGMGVYSKYLVPPEEMKPITQAYQTFMSYHYSVTAPMATGTQMLPIKLHDEHATKAQKARSDIEQAVSELVARWDGLVALAESRLGSLFAPNDYPKRDDVAQYFRFGVQYHPIAKSAQFQDIATLSEDIRADLVTQLERHYAEQAITATHHTIDKIVTAVGRKRVALTPDMVEVFRELNVADDPRLNTLLDEMERKLCAFDPDRVAGDSEYRKLYQEQAASLESKLRGLAQ